MADETTLTATEETNLFQQQQKTIETLMDVFEKQQSAQQQPVYVTQAAQQQQQGGGTPNYLLWIGLIAGFLLLTGKIKIG